MTTLLFSLILVSSLIIIILLFLQQYNYPFSQDKASLLTIFFAGWLISAVFFGTRFYIIPAPLFIDVTIERIFFFIIILITLAGFIKSLQKRIFSSYSLELLMGLFLVICVISMVRHGFFPKGPEFPSPWFVFITAYLFPFTTFFFAKYYITRQADIKLVFNVIFYVGAYLSVIAFFEFYQLHQLIFPRYIANPEIGIHFGQARGPFLNSPHLGMAVVFGFICGLHLLSYKKGMGKLILILLLLLFPPAVFFTQTRAVYLCFLIVLLVYLMFYRSDFPKWKVAILPASIAIITVFALLPILAQEDRRAGGLAQLETITIRQGLTQLSFIMIKDHPISGVGLSQFLPETRDQYRGKVPVLNRYQEDTYNHFHLLGMTVELGLTGVVVYLMIIILMYKRLFALSKYLSFFDEFMNNNLLVMIGVIWATFIVNFSFATPEYEIFTNTVIFMFAGVVDGFYQRQMAPIIVYQNSPAGFQYQETPA